MDRVQKLLSHAGYCSRREGEQLIKQGRVSVNGNPITIGDKATRKDEIKVDGHAITFDDYVYLAFHKPKDVLCAVKDTGSKAIITDYLQKIDERIYPVGRLDYDASGLIFLTNDGEFSNKVIHPRYENQKRYQVLLDKEFTQNDLNELKNDVDLKDGLVEVNDAVILNPKVVEISIHEGRNKIVKRTFRKLGFWVEGLIRVKIGCVTLGNLLPGEYRELKQKEINYFDT